MRARSMFYEVLLESEVGVTSVTPPLSGGFDVTNGSEWLRYGTVRIASEGNGVLVYDRR